VLAALEAYLDKYRENEANRLTTQDWHTLKVIRRFLKSLHDATLCTKGANATMDRVLPAIEYIMDCFEKGKQAYKEDASNTFLLSCYNAGWEKIDKYYALTNDTPVYITSIVLDPTMKWEYFEDIWEDKPNWVTAGKAKVQKF